SAVGPPTNSTRPSRRGVAVEAERSKSVLTADVQLLAAGSYSSAERGGPSPVPPTTSTLPVESSVALCIERGSVIAAAARQVSGGAASPVVAGASPASAIAIASQRRQMRPRGDVRESGCG